MSPEKIANDIVMQHKSASSVAEALKSKYGKQFTISRKLKEVFTILETTKSSSAKIHELNPLLKHVELFTKLVPGYALYIHFARHLTEYELEHGKRLLRERKLLKIENKDLSRDRDSLRKEVEKYKKYVKYEKHYRDAVNSKSYRIGRIVTAPIRLIKNLVK